MSATVEDCVVCAWRTPLLDLCLVGTGKKQRIRRRRLRFDESTASGSSSSSRPWGATACWLTAISPPPRGEVGSTSERSTGQRLCARLHIRFGNLGEVLVAIEVLFDHHPVLPCSPVATSDQRDSASPCCGNACRRLRRISETICCLHDWRKDGCVSCNDRNLTKVHRFQATDRETICQCG